MVNAIFGNPTTISKKASAVIMRGQYVGADPSAKSKVKPYPAGGLGDGGMKPLGVAQDDAAVGQDVAITVQGIAYVANGDDATAIDPGKALHVDGYAGAVMAATTSDCVCGYSLETIAKSGTGRALVLGGSTVY